MTDSSHDRDARFFTSRQLLLRIALLAVPGMWATTTAAVTIGPGETETLIPVVVRNNFGLRFDIASPQGSIEIRDLDASMSTLATTTIIFDSSGDGSYHFDASYRGAAGLVDIESLFPGLDLMGQLGGDPGALEPWTSVHTELSSGKWIWSFSDGTVITYDPNSSVADVVTNFGTFVATAPDALLELPATIVIENNTPGPIDAVSFAVPEPGCAPMFVAGVGLLLLRRRWRTSKLQRSVD